VIGEGEGLTWLACAVLVALCAYGVAMLVRGGLVG
jgi:hypothetical protein